MRFWFGSARKRRAPASSPAAPALQSNARAQTALQREVVNVALQGTLIRHGIPRAWVGAELHLAPSTDALARSDICLVVRQWGGLPWLRAAAFQRTFVRRISLLDPKQHTWLRDVVWQFKLHEDNEPSGATSAAGPATVPATLDELGMSEKEPASAKAPPPAREESAKDRQSRLAAAGAKLLGGRRRDSNFGEFEDTMPMEKAH